MHARLEVARAHRHDVGDDLQRVRSGHAWGTCTEEVHRGAQQQSCRWYASAGSSCSGSSGGSGGSSSRSAGVVEKFGAAVLPHWRFVLHTVACNGLGPKTPRGRVSGEWSEMLRSSVAADPAGSLGL